MKTPNRRNFLSTTLAGGMAVGAGLASMELLTGKAHAMRTIVGAELGRIVILSFDRGELFLEGIRDKVRELGIKNAVLLSAIGTFEKARYHKILHVNQLPEDKIFSVEGPMELSSVSGIVADGEPHFHTVFADLENHYIGHLEDGCVVCYLAEVVIAELKGVELTRIPNEYGIGMLHEK